MSKTNILVVEDESIVAKDIQNSLKKLGYEVPFIADSGEEAIDTVEEIVPDLVLMDIMLKGEIDGIEAAAIIKERYNVPVIFLTAYADESTLGKARLSEPYGYIIKPYKEIDLHTTIEIALYKHQKDTELRRERDLYSAIILDKGAADCIFVKSNSRQVRVPNKDIQYVEALKDYVIIHTKSAKYTIHSTMKDIYKKLQSSEFIRIHRSYIVSVEKITAIDYPSLYLEDIKKPLPIGGSFKDDLVERLNFV